VRRAVWILSTLLLTGCAYIGPPLPPSVDIPARVTDLRAAEIGENIVVLFTLPMLNTQGLNLKGIRSVELRITAPDANPVMEPVPATGPGPVQYRFPAKAWVGKDVTMMVRATGSKRKASDWSNQVMMHIDPPLAEPADLKVANAEMGVRLSWQGTGHYRIFRAEGDQQPDQIGETDKPEYADESTDYGKSYRYYVQAAAGALQQSEVAGPATIVPADVFPPAVPVGLTAVPGVGTIELAWERNIERDFRIQRVPVRGRRVFRKDRGTDPCAGV